MRIFVTGGGGFLGRTIVRELHANGHEVISFSRKDHRLLTEMGITHIRGDVSDYSTLKPAMEGCEAVFHVAAKVGDWGHHDDFYRVNVLGTENVVQACRELKIRNLVFTSSPSVVFDGKDSEGHNESLPYAKTYSAWYPQTKAIAEKLVMTSNDATLKTVSLRPHLIWGPGDPYYLPHLLQKAHAGKLANIGRSAKLVDCIYIDNAAKAHLQAFDQLIRNPVKVEGKTYFISQGQPIPISELINKLIATGGFPPVSKTLSPSLVRAAGRFLETVYRIFNIQSAPPITYFLAQQLSTAHWYDISAAKNDFGYLPEISLENGMHRLQAWVLNSSERVSLKS